MFPEGRIVDFLIVAVVALIVVGPKDLPRLMRTLGHFTAKLRSMAAEFRASFDEMARQSELDDLRREVENLKSAAPTAAHLGLDNETQAVFTDLDSELRRPAAPMPADYQYPTRIEADVAPAALPAALPMAEPPEALAAKAGP